MLLVGPWELLFTNLNEDDFMAHFTPSRLNLCHDASFLRWPYKLQTRITNVSPKIRTRDNCCRWSPFSRPPQLKSRLPIIMLSVSYVKGPVRGGSPLQKKRPSTAGLGQAYFRFVSSGRTPGTVQIVKLKSEEQISLWCFAPKGAGSSALAWRLVGPDTQELRNQTQGGIVSK